MNTKQLVEHLGSLYARAAGEDACTGAEGILLTGTTKTGAPLHQAIDPPLIGPHAYLDETVRAFNTKRIMWVFENNQVDQVDFMVNEKSYTAINLGEDNWHLRVTMPLSSAQFASSVREALRP